MPRFHGSKTSTLIFIRQNIKLFMSASFYSKKRIFEAIVRRCSFILGDEIFVSLIYKCIFGESLDLNNPRRFNAKLQWLKLYDRNPKYTKYVDKFDVKAHVASLIGKEYIIPTLSIYEDVKTINWDALPEKFVLKTTHGGGGTGIVVCTDKKLLDIHKTTKKLEREIAANVFAFGREWPYKNLKRRIIAEEFIVDDKTKELRDYKFFCFNGKVKMFKVDFNRFSRHQANYYDRNGILLPFGEENFPPDFNKNLQLPANLSKMIEIAEILAKEIPFVRVDLYNCMGRILFGEMTLYPASGFGRFTPDEWDYIIGDWLRL